MKISKLFSRTERQTPKDETSANAQFLERGGFIYKNNAGIYTFLPLGWRVMGKIAQIIREEMKAIGGQEIFMPAMVDKRYMDATGRWEVEVAFEIKGKKEKEARFTLGWTHEEVITEIVSKYISSYKDLPFSAYQIQTKFRDEPRAKSGLLRGREFMMKDLYSFHASESDMMNFYNEVKDAYHKIFERCGLKAIYTLAAGGVFTASTTNEFQVLSPVGEDTIYVCAQCGYAENKEISSLKDDSLCLKCGGKVKEEKAIEVGNIFPLGTKYTEALNLQYVSERGEKNFVVMGSYGIGLSRLMGTVVEVHHDDKGIIWPESISPFKVHLIVLDHEWEKGEQLYKKLLEKGVEVLYDDREEKTAGEKFADADLFGLPIRLVISTKTLKRKSVELKRRENKETELIKLTNIEKLF
ncbi:MAG: prolyl-tRNA synthetase [Parcubacteria group bacterium Gr01-1014_44]|nr:MAG: prolyl-tRNA synthetase [Parcubacteria group bacterium Gr01-1014_44]